MKEIPIMGLWRIMISLNDVDFVFYAIKSIQGNIVDQLSAKSTIWLHIVPSDPEDIKTMNMFLLRKSRKKLRVIWEDKRLLIQLY